ncbi:MAG: class I SAM-dependent methyltransferase [Actinomycetota bacterium]
MVERSSTDRVRAVYDRLADRYDRGMGLLDRLVKVEHARRWIASRARGDALDVGVGTGLNLPHYGNDVVLTGVDLSPAMLAQARRRAEQLGRPVTLHEADAQSLPFGDGAFDTVVFGLCLCSIPNDRLAVAEGARVLRPGGRLLLLEHVRSSKAPIRSVQRLLDPLSVRFQADHLTREPLDHVRAEGLQVDEVERWALGAMQRASARKPER